MLDAKALADSNATCDSGGSIDPGARGGWPAAQVLPPGGTSTLPGCREEEEVPSGEEGGSGPPPDPNATHDESSTDRNVTRDDSGIDPKVVNLPAARREPVTRGTSLPQVPGYELLSVLGRGGMGVVYLARQTRLKRLVALKMIRGSESADDRELARFRIEGEAIAKLQHPGIVQIYEVGDHDGQPFFSLEYVSGGSLDKKLAHTPQPPRDAAHLTATLARSMHAAHQLGIVHRDLKPANVLLTPEGSPKITDFGLAKQLDDSSGPTHTGAIMGTPSYMAPEQAAGQLHGIGPAADVYALGAVLYEMLTGAPPFRGATLYETLDQVRQLEPVPPSRLQPKVTRDLETICLKCLQKDPARRYASGAALADDLDRYLNDEPIQARRPGVMEWALKYARRKPWVVGAWVGAVAAVLFLVLGSGYYLYRRNLDLEAALARATALEGIRGQAAARLATAAAAQQQRNWPGVVAAANEARALVGDEPVLADLKERAQRLRAAAENVQRFVEYHDQTLYHAVLALEEGDQQAHRQAAQASARAGLALFGLAGDGPVTLPHFGAGSFTADTERWLTESCYEIYLTWAAMLSPTASTAAADKAALAGVALRLLDRVAPLGLTTKSYHQRRAELLRLRGDGDEARQEQEKAAALTPTNPVDHFLLALEANRAGELAQAGTHLKKVLEQQPDHFWANYYLAGWYLRLRPQRFERALAPLTACVQLKPKFVWPYLLRGFVYGELNDFEAAFAEFDMAEKLSLDEMARYGLLVNRAVVRMRQGMSHKNRAEALRQLGQGDEAEREAQLAVAGYDAAVPDLEAAVKLRPHQPQAYANLAEVHLQCGRLKEALPQLDQAIALAPSAILYRTRARLHEKRGAHEAALPDLEEAIRLAETARGLRELAGDQLQRGRILFRLARYPEALEAFEKTLAAAPDLVVAHQLRGETLLHLSRFGEAVAALDHYQAKGTPSALASRARGLGRAKLGNYAGAIEDYTRALEIDRVEGKPVEPKTLAYRGWAYLIQEAPKLALRDFEEAVSCQGDNLADCYAGRGFAQVQLGQWKLAVSDAEAALQEGTVGQRTLYHAARIYAQAAAKVQADPEQRNRQGQERRQTYERRALSLLHDSCEKMPPAEQATFWNEHVQTDPALRPIRNSEFYARMKRTYAGPSK